MKNPLLNGWLWVPTVNFAEGLPYIVVTSIAVMLYKLMGFDNTHVAVYSSLLSLPWLLKPIWSPIVDIFSSKRRWIISMQLLLAAAFAAVALSLPGPMFLQASMASFMVVAFLSATHDIAADGFYILALPPEGQSFFVGIRTTVYRLAMLVGQGPLVILAGVLQVNYGSVPQAWAVVFYILAAFFALLAVYHAVVLPHPAADATRTPKSLGEVWSEFADSFITFFTKPGIITALLFILLYKLPEAQLAKLIQPFLLDPHSAGGLGLSTQQVGVIYGIFGLIGLMAGGIIGGVVISHHGLRRCIMPMAWSMSGSCGAFLILSYVGEPSLLLINICVAIEQFGYGFGTAAYVMYLIHFAKGPRATSHYAIATGLMSLGLMLPGLVAGYIQSLLAYEGFFIWTMACCAITIAVSLMARRQL